MEPRRSFGDLLDLSRRVASEFDARERRPWTIEVLVVELMKQVGDLSRHAMVAEGYYLADRDDDPRYVTSREDIADELADILHAIMRLADHYKIDLAEAHVAARQRELDYLLGTSREGEDRSGVIAGGPDD